MSSTIAVRGLHNQPRHCGLEARRESARDRVATGRGARARPSAITPAPKDSTLPRHRKLLGALGVACVAMLVAPVHVLATPSVPSGFVVENAVPGASNTFVLPTGLAFFPDGRFLVAEKQGTVWVVDGTGKHQIWNRQAEVHSAGTNDDRGLLDVAVD